MAAVCIRQGFLQLIPAGSSSSSSSGSSSSSSSHHDKLSTSVGLGPRPSLGNNDNIVTHGLNLRHRHRRLSSTMMFVPKASRPNGGNITPSSSEEDEEGVSLGTMKLPVNTDLAKFESLLFQWANSLFQGANLPLPVPLKVDKIPGGARLGFITIGDGATEVLVYIDCFVSPATDASPPIFRAIRNGNLRDKVAPGEQRIMKSLLAALQKSVQLAQV